MQNVTGTAFINTKHNTSRHYMRRFIAGLSAVRRCLHDIRSSFIPVRLHPGSMLSIYICLHDTNQTCVPERVIPERPHPGSRIDIGSKFSFQNEICLHVPPVSCKGGTEISKWIGWADQLTHVFDPSMLLQHFHSRMKTSM